MLGATRKQRKQQALRLEELTDPTSPAPLTETERMIREALGIVEERSAAVPVAEPTAPQPKTTSRSRVTSDQVRHMTDPLAYNKKKAESRHDRFHDEYMEGNDPKNLLAKHSSRLTLDPESIRSAIVWKEILGPPKSLE
jgi:hypothetical protein